MLEVMKVILNLYNTTDDTRVINKTLTAVKDITATPVENVSLLSPSFIVEYDATILTANYCYIADLNRYYYIREITLLRGNRLQFSCSVDVLKTYATDILKCDAVITRSESIGKPSNVPDKSLPINPNKKELLTAKSDFNVNSGNTYLVRVRESTVKYSRQ